MGKLLSTYLCLPLVAPFIVDLVWNRAKERLDVISQCGKGSMF